MNRKIKFRAWDKQEKKMLYNYGESAVDGFSIPPKRELQYMITFNGEIPNLSGVYGSDDGWDIKWKDNTEWKLMQFTGLKDKNGKEIYEGDIVKFSREDTPDMYTDFEKGVVIFKDCCFHINDDYEVLRDTSAGHYLCEIIGNIYENPELIK